MPGLFSPGDQYVNLNQLMIALLLGAVTASAPLAAEEHHHREHGAHEHGVAQLNVALEGNTLEIELESPAVNIVGFEHAPRDQAERQAVRSAMETLRNGPGVFALPASAACKLADVEVESALLEEAREHGHAAEHHATAHTHDGEAHADFRVHYRFHCATPDGLRYIDVQLFKLFPATEELDAQVVTPRGQRAVELNAGAARLAL
jgi:hypothetical protein